MMFRAIVELIAVILGNTKIHNVGKMGNFLIQK